MEAARHYAAAITLLRRVDDNPIDPTTLAGADVPTLMALDEARHLCCRSASCEGSMKGLNTIGAVCNCDFDLTLKHA